MISNEYNFIFFHVPKAAGSSVLGALGATTGASTNEDDTKACNFLRKQGIQWPNHAPVSLIKEYLGTDNYSHYKKFAFVRNPWDLLVSSYFYNKQIAPKRLKAKGVPPTPYIEKVIASESFNDWVKQTKHLGNTQVSMLTDSSGCLDLDYIGRFETIQADFSYMCSMIGIDNIMLPHSNKSKHRDYRDYYDDESIEIVRQAFVDDVVLFGYDFDRDAPTGNAAPRAWGRTSPLTYSGLNRWNHLADVGRSGMVLHPNTPNFETTSLTYHNVYVDGATRLTGAVTASNPNVSNPGVVFRISTTHGSDEIAFAELVALPRETIDFSLDLRQGLDTVDVTISVRVMDGLSTNHCTELQLSSLTFEKD